MLLRRDILDGIATGRVSVAFRRWKRPTVKAGGTLRTRVGMLAIESVDRVSEEEIGEQDARLAGFASRAALLERLAAKTEGELYRVAFRLSDEPDPRIVLRERGEISEEEVVDIARRLTNMDARAGAPWTIETLELIARLPAVRAADLAPQLGQERLPFKANVRKLKTLGLTESLETGYRLSPRGRAFLIAWGDHRTP